MTEENKQINGKAIVILVLGIFSIVAEEWIGFILGIVGIILFVMNRRDIGAYRMSGKGTATVGFVCSIVGTIIQFFDIID